MLTFVEEMHILENLLVFYSLMGLPADLDKYECVP